MTSKGKRTGTVAAKNQVRGMVAIATEDDGYTIIEILDDWELELGDTIGWNDGYGLGSEIYTNASKGTKPTVYVQNHSVSEANVKKQLLF